MTIRLSTAIPFYPLWQKPYGMLAGYPLELLKKNFGVFKVFTLIAGRR